MAIFSEKQDKINLTGFDNIPMPGDPFSDIMDIKMYEEAKSGARVEVVYIPPKWMQSGDTPLEAFSRIEKHLAQSSSPGYSSQEDAGDPAQAFVQHTNYLDFPLMAHEHHVL